MRRGSFSTVLAGSLCATGSLQSTLQCSIDFDTESNEDWCEEPLAKV